MIKSEFRRLFEETLFLVANEVEKRLGGEIPRIYLILLHGMGYSSSLFSVEEATDKLFLNEDLFYRIIDIAVVEVTNTVTTFFVRVSNHKPSRFNETWNNPSGRGPFKQLVTKQIRDLR